MRYLLSVMILLFVSACSSIRVETDYDPEVDFTPFVTYTIVHENKKGDDTLTSDRIIRALGKTLQAKGYMPTARESADFYVLFHTDVRTRTEIDTQYEYVGLYPYHYGYMPLMRFPTTTTHTYDEGKLVVDVVDPAENRIIWRGIGTDRIRAFDTPQERMDYIRKVIASVMKRFPAKRATEKE